MLGNISPAVEALSNGRRRLRWAAIGLHPDRPLPVKGSKAGPHNCVFSGGDEAMHRAACEALRRAAQGDRPVLGRGVSRGTDYALVVLELLPDL